MRLFVGSTLTQTTAAGATGFAPPVIFMMDLAVQGTSLADGDTWTVTDPDPLALADGINGHSVKQAIIFPIGTVTYFRGSIVGDHLLSGPWDDPPADLRPLMFRRLD